MFLSTFGGDYKIKRTEQASYNHVDLHFGINTVTFVDSGAKNLPEGDPENDVFPQDQNPGFIGCRYQQYLTADPESPFGSAFTIA